MLQISGDLLFDVIKLNIMWSEMQDLKIAVAYVVYNVCLVLYRVHRIDSCFFSRPWYFFWK